MCRQLDVWSKLFNKLALSSIDNWNTCNCEYNTCVSKLQKNGCADELLMILLSSVGRRFACICSYRNKMYNTTNCKPTAVLKIDLFDFIWSLLSFLATIYNIRKYCNRVSLYGNNAFLHVGLSNSEYVWCSFIKDQSSLFFTRLENIY